MGTFFLKKRNCGAGSVLQVSHSHITLGGEEEAGGKLASLLCDSQSLYDGSAFRRGGGERKKFIVFRVTDIAAFFFTL